MHYKHHYPKLVEIAQVHFGLDDLFIKSRKREIVRARVTVALILHDKYAAKETELCRLGLISQRGQWFENWRTYLYQNPEWIKDLQWVKRMYRSYIVSQVDRVEERVVKDSESITIKL